MKVVITGGDGQLARWLVRSAPESIRPIALSRGELDVVDRAAVEDTLDSLRPDLVVNCAAFTGVDAAEENKEAAFAVNRDGAASVARAAVSAGACLVHVSTDFVFDGVASTPYAPEAEPNPLSVYGQSKLAGEQAVRESHADALIVRTAWLYALDGRNFVTTMLRLMNERDRIEVVSDQVGTPTHCRTLAQALWGLVAARASGIHHITDTGVASWYDFAVAVKEEGQAAGLVSGDPSIVPIGTGEFPAAARRPPFSVLDKSETWALLGWTAPHWRTELRAAMNRNDG